ncbi:MAG: HD-GYP domain-containing protein [Synergistetes bacterium]|nr:HD-GYP domain-containing protein [Synergistota bacterium]
MSKLIRKSIFDLLPGDVIGEDIFGGGGTRVFLVPAKMKVSSWEECEALKLKLQEFGVSEIMVEAIGKEEGAEAPFINEIREKITRIFPVISEETRRQALSVIKSIADTGKVDKKEIDEAVDRMVHEVIEKRDVMVSLYALRRYDDYTFVHSVNVSMLAIFLGLDFGYDADELRVLGRGALLHDIGKMKVPNEIINKPGKLDPAELERIRKHPLYGIEMALSIGESEKDVLAIIGQHHEWFSGRGYPWGLKGEEIHPMARIVAVVDVFDALTTERSYKPKMLAYDAVSRILHEGPIHFDPTVLRSFVNRFSIYPVGSLVRLSDGKIGVVSKPNRLYPVRPVVKILYDEYGKEVDEPYEIDLLKSELFIEEVLDDLSKSLFYKEEVDLSR